MCNSNQKEIYLYHQFLDLISPKMKSSAKDTCHSSSFHKISENASFPPICYTTYRKGRDILKHKLTEIGFDRFDCVLPEKIFVKRILYLFSIIDRYAFMKNDSNPKGFFNIDNFEMRAIFFPVFVGIISSLSKYSKKDITWKALKSYAIETSGFFYEGDIQNYFPIAIPDSIDNICTLYQYCLDIILPDKLYEYSTKFGKLLTSVSNSNSIDHLNLRVFSDKLNDELYNPDTIFITSYCCEKFYSNLSDTLELYSNYLDKLEQLSKDSRETNVFNPACLHLKLKAKGITLPDLIKNFEENVDIWKTQDENLILEEAKSTNSPSGN